MSKHDCPDRNISCEYYPKCFSDNHHIYYPGSDYTTPLESAFRNLPENKQQTCRAEHDEIHAGEDPIKPSQELMRHAVVQAQELGSITLSATKRKKIGL